MKELERRFKIVAIAITIDERLEFLDEKVCFVADAIDNNHKDSESMVTFLEDSLLKINQFYIENQPKEN